MLANPLAEQYRNMKEALDKEVSKQGKKQKSKYVKLLEDLYKDE